MPRDAFRNVLALARGLDGDAAVRAGDRHWPAGRVRLHAVAVALLLSAVAPVGCLACGTKVSTLANGVSPAPRLPGVPLTATVVRLPPLARLDQDEAAKAASIITRLELPVSSRR